MTKKKQNKQPLVPELRFPEFQGDGEWDRLNGNELFGQINDKNHNGDLPVLAITQEHGAIPRELIDYNVSVTQSSVNSYKIVRIGDFIISLRSFQGGIEYSDYEGICSPAYVVLREKRNTVAELFKHLFKSKAFIRELTKNLEGLRDGKMISYKQFSEGLINLPSKPEQQKIADCLGSLDELIAAHSRKRDALQDHKKGLLLKLFPGTPTFSSALKKNAGGDASAPSQTTPNLRFPEFEGREWLHKKLDDIAPFQRGFDLTSAQLKLGNVPVVYSNGIRNYHDIGMAIAPGLVTGRSGTIGKIHFIENGSYWPHNTSLWVTSFKGNRPKFVYYLYESIGFGRFASGSGVPTLNRNDAHAFGVYLPQNQKEQKKIADCLSTLDALITAQAEQITALKEHKKGLMQQLFPNPEQSNT